MIVEKYRAFREGICSVFARDNMLVFGAQITARTREHSATDIGA
jgi:hypothetical protein